MGDYQKAFELYSESLPIRRETGDILGESTTLFNLAYAQRERGNLPEAHQLIDNAIQIVESVRAALASQDLRESFFALSQDIYNFKIDLLMRLDANSPERASTRSPSRRAKMRGRARFWRVWRSACRNPAGR